MIWRYALSNFLGWKVVRLIDYDGDVAIRFATPVKGDPSCYTAWRMSRIFRISKVVLHLDFTASGNGYTKEWELAFP